MPSQASCSRCGTAVPPGARVCANCGADVSGQQGQVATAYVAPTAAAHLTLTPTGLIDTLRQATIGEYEIKGELGQGGMASVYLAHDVALDRKVAIKVMSPALFSTAGMVERFKREARTAAALSHPNIIPIYAVKESAGVVFFVMKFVEGRSLESVVHQVGQLPISLAQAILYQVGQALGYAHRHGVVHRDIKPANIMLDKDGWAIVTDFGIAKVAESQGLTQTGATIGTPSYMSPEQCAAKRELTGASDQYSLGIVAYEMLAGRVPFSAETTVGLLFAHVHETPAPITEQRPDTPPEVAEALMRMLEKDAAARWPDVESAVAALGGAPVRNDDPLRAQMIELAGGRALSPAETLRTPMSPIPPSKTPVPTKTALATARRPVTRAASPDQARPGRRAAMWAVPALLAIGAGGWWLLRPQPNANPTQQVAAPPAKPQVETVVVQRPAPETSKTTPLAAKSPPPPAPSNTMASLPVNRAAESAFRQTEARALARRVRAAAAGAAPADLAAGDADAQAADQLARDGHYAEASARLAAAIDKWSGAEQQAAGHPRFARRLEMKSQVEQVIADFVDAFNAKSLPRIRQLYPGITTQQVQEWADLFLHARNLNLQLSVSEVGRTGAERAQAGVAGTLEYVDVNSGNPDRRPIAWRAVLTESPGGWKINSLQ